MSYEGREQHICSNGHLFEMDCQYNMYSEDRSTYCPEYGCKAKSVWENMIDDTNGGSGGSVGEIMESEFNKLLISPAVIETCNLGHQHQTSPAIYKIPKEGGLRRSFSDD